VYLDQLHLQPSQDAARQQLERLARRGLVRAPVSLTHFLETMKDNPTRRDHVQRSLLELSAGEVLATEWTVTRHEADGARLAATHEYARRRVVSRDVWDWVRPPTMAFRYKLISRALRCTPEGLFKGLARLPDNRALNERAREVLGHGAEAANASRYSLPSFQRMLLGQGIDDVVVGRTDAELSRSFRAVATRRAIQSEIVRARPSGLEPNDLTDLMFLSVALPYLDAVCVDRRMFARIEAARSTVGIPWARAFKKLEDLLTWVDATCC
jgi:hypothetical protein